MIRRLWEYYREIRIQLTPWLILCLEIKETSCSKYYHLTFSHSLIPYLGKLGDFVPSFHEHKQQDLKKKKKKNKLSIATDKPLRS